MHSIVSVVVIATALLAATAQALADDQNAQQSQPNPQTQRPNYICEIEATGFRQTPAHVLGIRILKPEFKHGRVYGSGVTPEQCEANAKQNFSGTNKPWQIRHSRTTEMRPG